VIGLSLLLPFPFLTYIWLSGKLAIETNQAHLHAWSNPGLLAAPIAISFMAFLIGILTLWYVLTLTDIDELIPTEDGKHDD